MVATGPRLLQPSFYTLFVADQNCVTARSISNHLHSAEENGRHSP